MNHRSASSSAIIAGPATTIQWSKRKSVTMDQRQHDRHRQERQARDQVRVGRFDDEGAVVLVEPQAVRGRGAIRQIDGRRGEQQGGVEERSSQTT